MFHLFELAIKFDWFAVPFVDGRTHLEPVEQEVIWVDCLLVFSLSTIDIGTALVPIGRR